MARCFWSYAFVKEAKMRNAKLVLVFLLVLVIALIGATFASAAGSPARVRIQRIGNPAWRPVDFHTVAAEIGTLDTGFDKFIESASAMLPPPDHVIGPCGICPGDPHAGPYNGELTAGVASSGFHEGFRFSENEFRDGVGVFLTFMVVPRPNAPTGSSPDFATGPIIPNSIFPIHIEGRALRRGQPFDPFLAIFDVPSLDDLGFPGYDGHSHFPIYIVTNDEFRELAGLPPVNLTGNYSYRLTMLDQNEEGYRIVANFRITR
jgi:hypothetical protein